MHALIKRWLEPGALESLQTQSPEALAAMVEELGLEDAEVLYALATPKQLLALVDDTLFADNDSLDEARFATLLEALVDLDAALAVERFRSMDEELVLHGLTRLVHVVDLEALASASWMSGIDTELERALEAHSCFELERFLLIARRPEAFDAVVTLVVELDQQASSEADRWLERCAAFTLSMAEQTDGGLAHVLRAAETLADDVDAAREERRRQRGYVSAADARAFLALAAEHPVGDDVITRRYVASRLPKATSGERPGAEALPAKDARAGASTALSVNDPATLRRRFAAMAPQTRDAVAERLAFLANVVKTQEPGLSPLAAAERVLELCAAGGVEGPHDVVPAFGRGLRSGGLRTSAKRLTGR